MPKIKPNTQKRKMTITRRPILIIIIILVITLVALITAKILASNNTNNAEGQTDDTTSEAATRTEALAATGESTGSSADNYDNPQTPKQYEGANPNTYDTLTGIITYTEVSGDILVIRTNIDQYISGTCDLTMTNNKVITKTSSIEQGPTTSSCAGFDIPTSELDSGTWQINIKVISKDNKTGMLTGEVTI